MIKNKNYKKGFTLLELLVVVLIIGILAAIALPQYRKAVYNSRYTTLKNLTKSIANAAEVYYLANDTYPNNFEDLDIGLPSPLSIDDSHDTYMDYIFDWGLCRVANMPTDKFTKCRNTIINMDYQIRFVYSPTKPGVVSCVSLNNNPNSIQAQICKQETQKNNYSSSGSSWLGYEY